MSVTSFPFCRLPQCPCRTPTATASGCERCSSRCEYQFFILWLVASPSLQPHFEPLPEDLYLCIARSLVLDRRAFIRRLQSISDNTTLSVERILERIDDGHFVAKCTLNGTPDVERRVSYCQVRHPSSSRSISTLSSKCNDRFAHKW